MEIEIGVKKYTIYYHYPYYFHSKDFEKKTFEHCTFLVKYLWGFFN